MEALAAQNPGFAARLNHLLDQLRAQGAIVYVEATVRPRARGYLIYGAYLLRRAGSARAVRRRAEELDVLNDQWGLGVPIRWRHPGGWRATRDRARAMASAFGVDYASRAGARRSKHYDGRAIDVWAVGLPRRLALRGPDGVEATFDLSGEDEPRDLSLSPAVVDWIEVHYALKKLRRDYPHWEDAGA
jgi:hypothetical protein